MNSLPVAQASSFFEKQRQKATRRPSQLGNPGYSEMSEFRIKRRIRARPIDVRSQASNVPEEMTKNGFATRRTTGIALMITYTAVEVRYWRNPPDLMSKTRAGEGVGNNYRGLFEL